MKWCNYKTGTWHQQVWQQTHLTPDVHKTCIVCGHRGGQPGSPAIWQAVGLGILDKGNGRCRLTRLLRWRSVKWSFGLLWILQYSSPQPCKYLSIIWGSRDWKALSKFGSPTIWTPVILRPYPVLLPPNLSGWYLLYKLQGDSHECYIWKPPFKEACQSLNLTIRHTVVVNFGHALWSPGSSYQTDKSSHLTGLGTGIFNNTPGDSKELQHSELPLQIGPAHKDSPKFPKTHTTRVE